MIALRLRHFAQVSIAAAVMVGALGSAAVDAATLNVNVSARGN
ncbi:hypothetical protein HDG32_001477 [Paraburkholderia sp. CI2]|nr:hypothetical protein [Paraburkholderia sp. CI2]